MPSREALDTLRARQGSRHPRPAAESLDSAAPEPTSLLDNVIPCDESSWWWWVPQNVPTPSTPSFRSRPEAGPPLTTRWTRRHDAGRRDRGHATAATRPRVM